MKKISWILIEQNLALAIARIMLVMLVLFASCLTSYAQVEGGITVTKENDG